MLNHKLTIALALACGLAAASTALAQDKKQMSIATGTTGAVYYPLGGAMANILSKKLPGWAVTAEATAGAVANLHMIRDGKAELALVQADSSYDALKGQDKFVGKPVAHRTLAIVYPNLVHIVTMEGTGIEKAADIKGKRISTGAPVSASEVMAARVMEAVGITNNDIKRERLAPAESTAAMKDGKLDGYFFNGGPPVAAITDLGATQGVKLKLIPSADLVEKINAKYGPLYSPTVIKANLYPGQDKEVPVVAVWNLLVAPEAMPEETAYNITKTLWESRDDLVATHKAALDMLPENQKKANTPVPYHPGALKYFAEKGIKVE
jgi:TRAP transporter TAXI family solute receptor